MKTASVREVKERLSAWLREAQRESVLVVTHGRPTAVLIGIEGLSAEDVVLAELHRRRMTPRSQFISGAEASRMAGVNPKEEARWRRRALREVRGQRRRR